MNKQSRKQGLLRTLHYLVMVIFCAYYAGITLFVHHHIVNGVLISHSHPYNIFNPDAQNHNHSANAFRTIDLLTHLQALDIHAVAPLFFFLGLLGIIMAGRAILRCQAAAPLLFHLRAPPFFSVL